MKILHLTKEQAMNALAEQMKQVDAAMALYIHDLNKLYTQAITKEPMKVQNLVQARKNLMSFLNDARVLAEAALWQ